MACGTWWTLLSATIGLHVATLALIAAIRTLGHPIADLGQFQAVMIAAHKFSQRWLTKVRAVTFIAVVATIIDTIAEPLFALQATSIGAKMTGGAAVGRLLTAGCFIRVICTVRFAIAHKVKGYAAEILAHILELAAIALAKAAQATWTVAFVLATGTIFDAVAY